MKNAYCLLTTQYWSSHAQRQADGQAGRQAAGSAGVCAMGAGSAPQSDEYRRVFLCRFASSAARGQRAAKGQARPRSLLPGRRAVQLAGVLSGLAVPGRA
jgi:hypothetical protein